MPDVAIHDDGIEEVNELTLEEPKKLSSTLAGKFPFADLQSPYPHTMTIYWNYCRPHIFLALPTIVVGLHHPDTAFLLGRNRVEHADRFAIKPCSEIDVVVINFLTQIKACFDCGVFALPVRTCC